MAALDTVGDYITRTRVLLQDTVADYRFSDDELVENLNLGFLEMRRLRPDLMISTFSTGAIPQYSSASPATAVALDPQYRVALLYYVCGMAQMRDEEPTQDARASVFLNKFTAQMLTIQA